MSLDLLFSFFIMFSGVYVFFSFRKHLLFVLLSLEYIVLSVYFFVFLYLSFFSYGLSFLLIFLIFCVCEGALGLSILISMIRVSGNDYVFGFSLFLC
uniref:NADH-ubiquinone oxidoreductase chain 4L n=1 Tax=Saussurella borneensis TaxID=510017 RepID=A0A8F2FA13_9ORTH|nr:NADH dehydrogenase subunit 4L [Saussurella borneensis]